MKNSKALGVIICVLIMLFPFSGFAKETTTKAQLKIPKLTFVQFDGAKISGNFSSDVLTYDLVLSDTNMSPTLAKYTVDGDANLFVTYSYDGTNHQTGLEITLEYSAGTLVYTFNYLNTAAYTKNGENHLSAIACSYGEIKPQLNDNDTAYKLYVPSDLTELRITPTTKDVNAYCAPINMVLAKNQELTVPLNVTASDGTTKEYKLKIKRVDKTLSQVQKEMQQPGYTSFVEGTKFYQQESFVVATAGVCAGVLILAALFFCTRGLTVKVIDTDEPNFYC